MNPLLMHGGILLLEMASLLIFPLWFCRAADRIASSENPGETLRFLRAARLRLILGVAAFAVGVSIWVVLDLEAVLAGKRNGVFTLLEVVGFHAIWWPLGMPLLLDQERRARERRLLAGGPPTETVRTASLVKRSLGREVSRGLLVLPWCVAAICFAWFTWRSITAFPGTSSFAGALTLEIAGLIILTLYPVWMRLEVEAPQVLAGDGEDLRRLTEELGKLRTFRVRGVFLMQLAMASLFLILGNLQLEVAQGLFSPKIVGLLGGLGGCAVGLLGAAFGTLASLKGYRVQHLRAKLETNP